MASIVKRGQKYYAVYKDAGKQKWLAAYTDAKTSQAYADKLEDDAKRIADGLVDPVEIERARSRRLAVETHIFAYETHLRAAQRRPNHIAYTLADIRKYASHSGVVNLCGITRQTVDTWVLQMVAADKAYREWRSLNDGPQQGEPNSARTINRRVGSLQAFLKWAHNSGAVAEYALRKYPKQEVRGNAIRNARALNDAEAAKLLRWAKRNAIERHDTYLFAIRTGCRLSEIASLTAASFNLKAGTVTVHSKDPRHTDRVDTIPLHSQVLSLIKKRLKTTAPSVPIFGTVDHAAEQLRADCAAAGVDPTSVSFHGLRHTFVSEMARRGVHPTTAQKLARHRDIAMTLGYYTHWSTDDERIALEKLGGNT